MKCPLCENTKLEKLEKVKKDILIYLYKKLTGYNFDYLITQDLDYFECINCKLRFFYPLLTGDENFYSVLQKFDWYYMDNKEEYFYATSFIKNDDTVLEVGCGKAAFGKLLAPKTENYIGLDLSENAKKLAKMNGLEIANETIQNYAQKNENIFDVVVSFQVLEHVSDPKSFIEAKLKTLKPGGIMIVGVPCEDSFLKYATNCVLNMPPHHVTRWSNKALEFIAEKYNLKIEAIFHEKVQDIHKSWFLTTFLNSFFLENKLIDISIKFKIINKFCSFFVKLFFKNLKNEMLPYGHTCVVVYKNKNNETE